jgi:polyisoprenoid-binding protein YceI
MEFIVIQISSYQRLIRTAVLLVLSGTACLANSATLAIKPDISDLSFTFTQMGVPVKAVFKNFSGQIDYDPAAPDAARAKVSIDVKSIDMGDALYNQEVLAKDWLHAAQFPEASFAATSAAPQKGSKGNGMEISGDLSIKGKTVPVRVPATVRTEGRRQVFEGAFPISRLAFGLGEGEWRDTSIVKDQVLIHFRLVGEP